MNKIVVFVSFFILLFFFNRGFAYYDEGFILHATQRVMRGEIPYKDFDLIYTPATIYLTAAAFKIFGESVLSGRILMFLVGLLTSYLIYIISFRATKNSLTSFLSVLIYLGWGPTHINFPWPSMLVLTAAVAALWALPRYYLVGLLTAVVFLIKQNFGVAVFLSVVIGLEWTRGIRGIREFFLGIITGLAPFLGYLLLTNSLAGFLDNFYFYTIKRFLFEGAALTPFPSGVKGLFYLLPGLISLVAILLAFKKHKKLLTLPVFTLLFYLFGIRPTTDFVHLTTLMSITGLPLSVIFSNFQISSSKKQTKFKSQLNNFSKKTSKKFLKFNNLRFVWRTCWLIFGVLLIGLGFYTGLFKNYYRWDSPIIKQNFFVSNPKAKILVDQKFYEVIPRLVSEIKRKSGKEDYIFIFPNASMFYFLTGRKNPTRFIGLAHNFQTRAQEQEIIKALQSKNVRLVLTNEPIVGNDYKIIRKYILDNFKKKKEIFEFSLWERK